MEKKHISLWIYENDLNECDANMKLGKFQNRSDYINEAVKFYNSYLHNQNSAEYISKTLMNTMQGMMNTFERRMGRMMFKQAVEIAKVFWLVVRGFHLRPEEVDDFHSDCVAEVKRINGVIQFPFQRGDESE